MTGERRRGLKHCLRIGVALGLLACGASACAPVVGGAALAVVVGVGALTSHCYDYLDVTVLDDQGRKTCAATVTAKNRGDEFELKSCYYAPLTDGHWTIRASQPGMPDAISTVEVEHANDCTRHVQSMELTLSARANPALPAAQPPAAPAPEAPPAPAPAPEIPPAPPAASSSAAPAPSAPAAASAAPPVGVFPDSPPNAGQNAGPAK